MLGDARLRVLLDSWRESMTMQHYREAETAAKESIELMLQSGAANDIEMAGALNRLASAQQLGARHEAAILNYRAAISMLENTGSALAASLIRPLMGLGDTYMAAGQADLALATYDRALHVQHVNEGPHSLDQVDILDAILEAYVESGDPDAALSVVDRQYQLYARRVETDSEDMLPVLSRRAALLNRLGRHQDERLTYLDMVRIIEKRRGAADASLIDHYTAIGRTYLHEVGEVKFRSEPTGQTGETYFRKAVEVARDLPDGDSGILAERLIDLGDWYTVLNAQDKARRAYREAWTILSADKSGARRRVQAFDDVTLLLRPEIDRYAHFGYRSAADEPDAYAEGCVIARFRVNARGRVTDIEIDETQPADFQEMEIRVKGLLREAVYRPRYAAGEPVASSIQIFRHDFLYEGQGSADCHEGA